ncbi:type 1 glutamine amidotransferase [uncultured Paludibaculum sp.]|uniref:type 1 glutamine amidotransferase n=1 Tax=uncultured Paludibaculum sp. TaxID=1765020 RepID=UPI002AAA989C|nr:type 1 glutamine amidotransferase [uncultured Paludibaculum sp.]
MRIHSLQHVAFESPGLIGEWAAERGYPIAGTRLDLGEPLPSLDDFDLLLVMGGPMSVNDEAEHPWLRPEKQLIATAMAAGKFVIGVCLGSQMLAEVLGAHVYRNREKEIGWFPVQPTGSGGLLSGLPAEFTVFHWHGETYDIPAGVLHTAETPACRSQAFETERCLGLQFHMEMTAPIIEELLVHCASDLGPGPYQQTADQIRAGLWRVEPARALLYPLLDRVARRAFVVA